MTNFRSIGGVNYSNWEETYSIDFSDYDSWVPANNDIINIRGVAWQAASSSDSGGPEIIAGTGLVMSPRPGSTMYNAELTDTPYLFANMTDLVPNLSEKDIVCMQWTHDYSASSGDQQPVDEFESVGGQIWNSDTDAGWYGIGIKGFYLTDALTWCPWGGPGGAPNAGIGEYTSDTDDTKFRSFEVVFSFTGQTAICSSPSGSTTVLEDPFVADYKRVYATGVYGGNNSWASDASMDVDTDIIKSSAARAMLYAYTQDATPRGFKGIFTKFRIFRSRTA